MHIDETAIPEYLNHTNQISPPNNKFIIDKFDNEPKLKLATEIENTKKNT